MDLLANSDNSKGTVTHRSHIFTDFYELPSYQELFKDAKRSIMIENAGGKSEISELYSIDYFARLYKATDFIFEEEVQYWIRHRMVDFICTIDGLRIGVSVARAMGYPNPDNFNEESASRLLYKKLYGLIIARNAVIKSQSFYKSILHIWCQNQRIAQLLQEAFSKLDNNDYGLDVKGVLILQLTVCEDIQLYKNILLY
jgi:hypothetical protein